jgi:glutamate-1-semialdehyde 2,1-aminomutase
VSESSVAKFAKSAHLFEAARNYIPGGVSSRVRASHRPHPLFFESASGSRITDVDGNRYIDYALAWGPLILGHSNPAVLEGVKEQLDKLQLAGAQNRLEIEVAEKIVEAVPCAEQVAFSSTGSEAVQTALRLARAFTGRNKIIKFEGHYHGWIDNILIGSHSKVRAGSSDDNVFETEGQSMGVLDEVFVLPWNDMERLEDLVDGHPSEIAAIITEPILCNCSCLMPSSGYLESMRDLASRYGIVLIFDEIITGFRVAPGGAQDLFKICPDLAVFGKALGGGFPLSAVAGKREIMDLIGQHRVLHAGTFNGNPISLAAAKATLSVLEANSWSALEHIRNLGNLLQSRIRTLANEMGIPILVNGVGAAFHVSFTKRESMRDARDCMDCNLGARQRFIEAMLRSGVYLLPDGRWYISASHSEADVEMTEDALRKVFASYGQELKPHTRTEG